MATRYGWHIVRESRKLQYGDGRSARVGVRMRYRNTTSYSLMRPRLCSTGMHAAVNINSAMQFLENDSDYLCRVRVSGTGWHERVSTQPQESYVRKFCGTHRTVLGMVPVRELIEELGDDWNTWEPGRVMEVMRRRNRRNGTRVEVR